MNENQERSLNYLAELIAEDVTRDRKIGKKIRQDDEASDLPESGAKMENEKRKYLKKKKSSDARSSAKIHLDRLLPNEE